MKKNSEMTQRQLAEKMNVTAIYLNSVLKGRRVPSIKFAINLERESGGKYRAEWFRSELKEIR